MRIVRENESLTAQLNEDKRAFTRIVILAGGKFTGTEEEFNKLLADIHDIAALNQQEEKL